MLIEKESDHERDQIDFKRVINSEKRKTKDVTEQLQEIKSSYE